MSLCTRGRSRPKPPLWRRRYRGLVPRCLVVQRGTSCVTWITDHENFDWIVKLQVFIVFYHRKKSIKDNNYYILYFSGLALAYHIWHMDVSPLDNVSRTFMIPIQC